MRSHVIKPKQVGHDTLCSSCLRGIVQSSGGWRHIVRAAWKG